MNEPKRTVTLKVVREYVFEAEIPWSHRPITDASEFDWAYSAHENGSVFYDNINGVTISEEIRDPKVR